MLACPCLLENSTGDALSSNSSRLFQTSEQCVFEPESLRLKSLVDEYLEPSAPHTVDCRPLSLSPQRTISPDSAHQQQESLTQELQAILCRVRVNAELLREVTRATRKAEYVKCILHNQQQLVVLEHLRKTGYNAGICKSKRDNKLSGFPVDEHEYMDVILEKSRMQANAKRVFIDLRFRSQFEIARPTCAYRELLKMVPKAYVGGAWALERVIEVMSEATKSSLESQGMPVPPWRRLSFLHAKWFSPNHSRSVASTRTNDKALSPSILFNYMQQARLKDCNTSCIQSNIKSCIQSNIKASLNKQSHKNVRVRKQWQPPLIINPRNPLKPNGKFVGALAVALHGSRTSTPGATLDNFQFQ